MSRHLSESELIDLAESPAGAGASSLAGHLASCDACRRQVEDLRGLMNEVGAVDVPEPSPLFWDHFSARVRNAVTEEPQRTFAWKPWRIFVPVAAVAALAIAAAVTLGRSPSTPAIVEAPSPAPEAAVDVTAGDFTMADDPSLSLIADMAGDIDWDSAVEAGLTMSAGSVDRVVNEMSADERLELQRLLKEELSRSGV